MNTVHVTFDERVQSLNSEDVNYDHNNGDSDHYSNDNSNSADENDINSVNNDMSTSNYGDTPKVQLNNNLFTVNNADDNMNDGNNSDNDDNSHDTNSNSVNADENDINSQDDANSDRDVSSNGNDSDSNSNTDNNSTVGNAYKRYPTRMREPNVRLKDYYTGFYSVAGSVNMQYSSKHDGKTPRTVPEAMRSAESEQWMTSINTEYTKLNDNGTFKVVDYIPSDGQVIGTKLVFKKET
jgi:hypothetical protein